MRGVLGLDTPAADHTTDDRARRRLRAATGSVASPLMHRSGESSRADAILRLVLSRDTGLWLGVNGHFLAYGPFSIFFVRLPSVLGALPVTFPTFWASLLMYYYHASRCILKPQDSSVLFRTVSRALVCLVFRKH